MKKMMSRSLLVFVCWSLLLSVAFAEVKIDTAVSDPANTAPKKKIALLFVNNAKATFDGELNAMVMENFDAILKPKYEVLPGTKYIELLNKVGIADITTAERADIMSVVKGEDVDYIFFAELQPFVRKEKITYFTYGLEMTAIVPVKIIDVKQNVYIYNGKFTELAKDSSAFGGIGNKSVALKALRSTLDKMNSVVDVRLP
ncbi:MAG TPA: hypothetical protein VN631_14365 [Negativicutes bacterium]|nr:hypothetical protein [Negativicutes bacterium]